MCQLCPWCHVPPRAGRRVIHRVCMALFPYGKCPPFPCQAGSAQGSLRSQEHPARDLFGASLPLGCSGNTLPLPWGGDEHPPAEGVVAPLLSVPSLARPALVCCWILHSSWVGIWDALSCQGPHRWPGGCCHCHTLHSSKASKSPVSALLPCLCIFAFSLQYF